MVQSVLYSFVYFMTFRMIIEKGGVGNKQKTLGP